jgi:hypothetical protein
VSRDTWPVIPKPRGKVDESLLCQLPNFINIDLRKEASYALGKFLLADGQYTGKYQSNDQWGRELHYIILAKVHIDKSIGKHLTVYGDIDLTYDLGRWSNDLEKVADPHTHTHTNTNTRTHTLTLSFTLTLSLSLSLSEPPGWPARLGAMGQS